MVLNCCVSMKGTFANSTPPNVMFIQPMVRMDMKIVGIEPPMFCIMSCIWAMGLLAWMGQRSRVRYPVSGLQRKFRRALNASLVRKQFLFTNVSHFSSNCLQTCSPYAALEIAFLCCLQPRYLLQQILAMVRMNVTQTMGKNTHHIILSSRRSSAIYKRCCSNLYKIWDACLKIDKKQEQNNVQQLGKTITCQMCISHQNNQSWNWVLISDQKCDRGLIAAFGIVGIIYMAIQNLLSLRFFLVFSPIFVICFGFCLIAIQFKNQFVFEHFGFLKSLLGRAIFNIQQLTFSIFSLSSEVYYFFGCANNNSVLAWISSMILLALGVLYLILHYCAGNGYGQNLKQQLS